MAHAQIPTQNHEKHPLHGVFCRTETFSFVWSHLLLVLAPGLRVPFLSGNSSLVQVSSGPFPIFYQIRGIWSYFRPVIHLELNFVQDDRHGSICNVLHAATPSSVTRNTEVAVSSTAFSRPVYRFALHEISSLITQDCSAMLRFLCFHMKLKILFQFL